MANGILGENVKIKSDSAKEAVSSREDIKYCIVILKESFKWHFWQIFIN